MATSPNSISKRIAPTSPNAAQTRLDGVGNCPRAIKDDWLRRSAQLLRENEERIAEANERDLAAAPGYGLTDAAIDRLRLNRKRIEEMAVGSGADRRPARPDRRGHRTTNRPNGCESTKVRVPLGVVFFIYESRPNVTADAAAICVKSGNAVILRGGKEAIHSSQAIVELLAEAADEVGLPADAVQLVEHDRSRGGRPVPGDAAVHRPGDSPRRRRADPPRGGRGQDAGHQAFHRQLPRVRRRGGRPGHGRARSSINSQVPADGRVQRGRVAGGASPTWPASFCRAIGRALAERGVEIRGDERTCELVPAAKPASDEDYAAEYLGPIISSRVVGSLDEAIEHINRYGSQHTDAIVTSD